MRIVITGQTGTEKGEFTKNIVDHYLKKRGGVANFPDVDNEISCYELEDPNWLINASFRNLITGYDYAQQQQIWADTFESILEDIEHKESKHILLLFHAAYYWQGRFSSPASWDLLLKFRPDCVITLIDDIYDIWQRVENREDLETTLTLFEILNWRNAEILYSQTLANELRIDNTKFGYSPPDEFKHLFGKPLPYFVMSVKHSPEIFDRLMFERERRQIVYASFPITRTRESEGRRRDIDKFRRSLRDTGAIVIDPLTIDELKMSSTIDDENGKEIPNPAWHDLRGFEKFKEYQSKRWQILTPTVSPPSEYNKNPFAKLNEQQINVLVRNIGQHINDRDFRLVSQCDRTVAYRPFYPQYNNADFQSIFGSPTTDSTGGVTNELRHALNDNQEVWVFHPKCDFHPKQLDKFFSDALLWNRVRRFPSAKKFEDLLDEDFSGFEELLSRLESEVRRK
jgi:hypothetical protein